MDIRLLLPAVDAELAHALVDLQRAAYAIEAALIGDDRIPPLHEDVEDLRLAPLHWLGAFTGPDVVGALAFTEDHRGVEVDRLIVALRAHRRGVGTALVGAVLQRAGTLPTTVATGRDNTPATSLYQRLGFTRDADEEVAPGLWITRYTHTP